MDRTKTPETKFSLRIEGNAVQAQSVPAPVLVQVLVHAQKAFEIIGSNLEGGSTRRPTRVSAATSRRYELRCELPQLGSYAVPVSLGHHKDLISDQLSAQAFGIFREAVRLVSEGSAVEPVSGFVGLEQWRRLLNTMKQMAPKVGSQWHLGFHDESGAVFGTFDVQTVTYLESIESTLTSAERLEASEVVIGELKSIDFAAREIRIIYPPTNRLLKCVYDESVEDLLYERRRDLIQVTGRVLLDTAGLLTEIIDVNNIRDVDLSPVEVNTVHCQGLTLLATPALILQPNLDDSLQLFCVEYPELGIDVFARTREALYQELQEQIAMLWQEYATTGNDELEENAVALKRKLLTAFKEDKDAKKDI
jgi:hypothetical protein